MVVSINSSFSVVLTSNDFIFDLPFLRKGLNIQCQQPNEEKPNEKVSSSELKSFFDEREKNYKMFRLVEKLEKRRKMNSIVSD